MHTRARAHADKYQTKMGTFLKQRVQSKISTHHTSESVTMTCILPQKRGKKLERGFEGVATVSSGVPCAFHAAVRALR